MLPETLHGLRDARSVALVRKQQSAIDEHVDAKTANQWLAWVVLWLQIIPVRPFHTPYHDPPHVAARFPVPSSYLNHRREPENKQRMFCALLFGAKHDENVLQPTLG